MDKLNTTDLIEIRMILTKFMNFNCSVNSNRYQEVKRLINLIETALISPSEVL